MQRHELLAHTGWADPYPGFALLPQKHEHIWHFDADFLAQVVYRHCPQPSLVLEVGSWLGNSAVCSVRHYLKTLHWKDFTLLCVDTWLGSVEHWLRDADHVSHQALSFEHGYPRLYDHFLSHVLREGLQDYIQPLPQTSVNAARILAAYELRFDWVFIDASHHTLDVLIDMDLYWPLVKVGGVLCGDDWNWPGVKQAVEDFSRDHQLRIYNSEHSWALFKN